MMKSLRLFPIFEDKFVYISDISMIILPSVVLPLLISSALDKLYQVIKNDFVFSVLILLFLITFSSLVYAYPNIINSDTQVKETEKITPRYSQRLFEKRQKTGML